jgi:hypothetical protein
MAYSVTGEVVRGWLDREEKAPHTPGQVWYLLNMDWWSNWTAYVNFINQAEIVTKKAKQLSLDSTDSSSTSGNIVTTSYSQLDSMTENHGLRPPSASDEVCKKKDESLKHIF